MTTRRRVLFVGPLPDPITGQSLACKVLLDDLVRDHDVDVIDLNRDFSDKGKGALGHARRLLGKVARMRRLRRGAFDRLDRTVVHLHGGAGMREIMRGKYPLLARLNRFFLRRAGAMVVLGPRLKSIYEGHLEPDRKSVV